jgi:hypothetical protein
MGLFDGLFGKGGKDYVADAAKEIQNVGLPDMEEQKLLLQQYVEQGILTPEQAQAQLLSGNAYDDMELDTEGKQAQIAALQKLSEIGNEGGLTASDKSKLQAIQSQEQTAARGARESILQNAAARGVGGSGLELMSQMQNQQDAATRQSARDLDVAAQAQERALQAIQAAGQMGGQMNQQQFGQQAQIADSQNEISRFNAANKQNVNMANVAANNQAQASNLASKQNVANANVDQANKQQQYNKELAQQGFNNQMSKAQGVASAKTAQGQQANQDREGSKNLFGSLLGAGATAFAKSDEDSKENVEDFDPSEFLDSITGYKYKYKNPKDGKGKQVGVMAQDLEKEVPQMVEDTPEGKMVDYSPAKAGGPIFASLGDLHERIKRLEGK